MSLSDFKGPSYIANWSSDLDHRWPERIDIFPSIVQTILDYGRDSDREDMHRLELGPGAVYLAEAILGLLTSHLEAISYLGIDINPE